jgi:hypothetical protein
MGRDLPKEGRLQSNYGNQWRRVFEKSMELMKATAIRSRTAAKRA